MFPKKRVLIKIKSNQTNKSNQIKDRMKKRISVIDLAHVEILEIDFFESKIPFYNGMTVYL